MPRCPSLDSAGTRELNTTLCARALDTSAIATKSPPRPPRPPGPRPDGSRIDALIQGLEDLFEGNIEELENEVQNENQNEINSENVVCFILAD